MNNPDMGSGDISAIHDILHWMLDYWQVVGIIFGGIVGAVVFWFRTTFATKAHMENCRVDMVDSYDGKMERYHRENKEEHKELRTDIKSILSHLLGKDHD